MKKISLFALVASLTLVFTSCSTNETTVAPEDQSLELLKSFKIKRDSNGAYTLDYSLNENVAADNVIDESTKKKNIYLIEDCAHAVLTSFNGKHAGNFGDAGAFSFYSTKSVASGEGGMITTNNIRLYNKMKLLTSYGMTKRYGVFDYKYFSSNYRMNEMEAIIGYHHLINYKYYISEL